MKLNSIFLKKITWAFRILLVLVVVYSVSLISLHPRINQLAFLKELLTPNTTTIIRFKPPKYLSSNLAASSRLGNHLFELSALLSISRKLERTPVFFIQDHYYDGMLKDTDILIPGLLDHFTIINATVPKLITPTKFNMKCCMWDNPNKLLNITTEYLHIKGTHFQSWKYFSRMRNELIGYLRTPTNNYTNLPKSDANNFITCVHIRRTDFVGSGFYVPDRTFIISAMKFVEDRERRKNPVKMTTVFFGDDIKYIESLTNETYILKDGTQKDLKKEAVISRDNPSDTIIYSSINCNVVLFTAPHSTFGWWMGFLSKGNQVYYTDIKYVDDNSIRTGQFLPDDYYPPHWTPFKYNEIDNSTIIETFD